jgi:hypothetical protein
MTANSGAAHTFLVPDGDVFGAANAHAEERKEAKEFNKRGEGTETGAGPRRQGGCHTDAHSKHTHSATALDA